jgi:hypothetical protein
LYLFKWMGLGDFGRGRENSTMQGFGRHFARVVSHKYRKHHLHICSTSALKFFTTPMVVKAI